MDELLASGRIVDIILVLAVLETSALAIYRRRSGRGIPTPQLVFNLAAGAFLLLALRAALVGSHWPTVPLLLLGSLAMHLLDVRSRWQ